jgi:alkanesulfonate monooxygenase SsuD/methylene tetrahydromethanopterin reductase-like flavin-dependent oxidoreductase (luciferase family)
MEPDGLADVPTDAAPADASLRIGVHTPLQHTSVAELRSIWQHAEQRGFDWVSVWDHLGSLDGTPRNFDAVAMHAALACSTETVQCACLVYSVGYRSPLVLASAIATVDHLSGGRAVLGLGAGYLAAEYQMQGRAMPSPRDRSDQLAETVDAVRSLLAGEEVTVDGRFVKLDNARCAPRPLQQRLPIVVGGGGEHRTIPLAARRADAWNVPLATPHDAGRKVQVLREHEQRAGRAPGSVQAILTVGLCRDSARLPERFGARWAALRPAVLTGSTAQATELLSAYVAAGADRVVLSLRAPFDAEVHDDLDWFVDEVLPGLG